MLHVDVRVCVKPEVMGTVVEVLVMMHSWVSQLCLYVALTDMCDFNTHHKLLQPPPVPPYHYSTGCLFVGVFLPVRAFPEPERTSSTRKRLSISPVRRAQTPRKPFYAETFLRLHM